LSSDAHHPDDLVNQFSDTAILLQKIGFKTLTILHEGHWQPFPYNEHGIIVR
jgi:histidinol-phosphatase (PHP family)